MSGNGEAHSARLIIRQGLDRRWIQLALVLALGVTLRFVNLSTAPLGYFHDEAWSDAKAYAILSGAEAPQAYFPENNGMDALHVYAIAALYVLTGPLAIGSRLVSAAAGSLAILATYWAASELFAGERRRHGIALTAAFVYATLFSALTVSRSGWHAISTALFATLSVAALLRAQRLGQLRWYIMAGVLGGLTQYTYPSARFLVVMFFLLALYEGWRQRARPRVVLIRYAALLLAASIVCAPLIVFFVQQPEWLFTRAQQTTEGIDLGRNLVNTLLAFSVRSDVDNLHNLPGRPLLDPILSVLFIVGLIACFTRHRAAHLLLLIGVVVFTLPALLTNPAPLMRRWTAALPFVAMMVGLGVVTSYDWLTARWTAALVRRGVTAFLVGLLLVSSGLAVLDYFGPYLSNPQMFWAYDAGITQVANYIRAQPDETIFLTPYDRFYEVVALTEAEAQRAPIQSYNGLACAVFPATTTRPTEWVVITEKDQRTLPLLSQIFPNNEIVWELNSPVGGYARALRVPAGQTAQLSLLSLPQADFGGQAQLVGVEAPPTARPGQVVTVTLALQNELLFARQHKVFLHLRNGAGEIVAQDDRVPCSNSLNEADWRPGDVVLETYQLALPVNLAAGRYSIVMGMYEPESGARLPVRVAAQPHDGDSVQLGVLQVQ